MSGAALGTEAPNLVTATRNVRNHLLANLSRDDYELLLPDLQLVDLPLRQGLEKPGQAVRFAYFPENCMVSVVADAGQRGKAEVGIIAYEGVTAHSLIMGDDKAVHVAFIQGEGRALKIGARPFCRAMARSGSLRQAMLSFVHAFGVQTAHTVLASGRGTLPQRLARWLLMAQDRLGGDQLRVTHEFLSVMLAVRRSGVTTTVRNLRQAGIIDTERGLIEIKDREALRELSNGLYGIPEKEYLRLLGWCSNVAPPELVPAKGAEFGSTELATVPNK
jgi:CRP-like cAMP-binding protein